VSRSDSKKPVISRDKPTDPVHGTLSPEQLQDAVLMHHPNFGERYILNADVKHKTKQGFKVVGGEKAPLAGKKLGARGGETER